MSGQGGGKRRLGAERDLLAGLHRFASEMTISQMVVFFGRQDVRFTKTMIQNYVRIGLLPPPVSKRFYHFGHLALLTIIDACKDVLSLDEMKIFFRFSGIDFENFENEREKTEIFYRQFLDLRDEIAHKMRNAYEGESADRCQSAMFYILTSAAALKAAQVHLLPD